MTFIHEDPELRELLTIVGEAEGISRALIEKDYWAIHSLWALQNSNLEVWFKGGTSLAKGFSLIQRFSEDLDLRIQPGSADVPEVSSWTSMNRGLVEQRRRFYEALAEVIKIPNASMKADLKNFDRKGRGAHYQVEYPGLFLEDLSPAVRPFVLLEVGIARVTPHVERRLSSFVHDWLASRDQLSEFVDNRPLVRCVHPLVTLIEKLDAISRRFDRKPMEPASFVRHYADAAKIISGQGDLPPLGFPLDELVREMSRQKQIRRIPHSEDPAWTLEDFETRQALEHAYQAIAPMFWGERISLPNACAQIQGWLRQNMTTEHSP